MSPLLRLMPLASTLLLLAAPSVRADIPPDEPETCLMERYDAARCVSCSAWREEPDKCAHLAKEGKARACSTYGATAWSEIWCAPGVTPKGAEPAPATSPAPATTTKSGCAGATSASLVGLVASALLGLVATRRRRG